MPARFGPTVLGVLLDDQRLIEEYLFGFGGRYPMLIILAGVSFVPIEAGDAGGFEHALYIISIYTAYNRGKKVTDREYVSRKYPTQRRTAGDDNPSPASLLGRGDQAHA